MEQQLAFHDFWSILKDCDRLYDSLEELNFLKGFRPFLIFCQYWSRNKLFYIKIYYCARQLMRFSLLNLPQVMLDRRDRRSKLYWAFEFVGKIPSLMGSKDQAFFFIAMQRCDLLTSFPCNLFECLGADTQYEDIDFLCKFAKCFRFMLYQYGQLLLLMF